MFDRLISMENIYESYKRAYKGRKKKKDVIIFRQDLENNIFRFKSKMSNFTLKHSSYNTFIIEDSKKRVINSPKFEDHILHHSIFSFLEEIFEKKFIENSFANRIGKGSHRAVLKLQEKSRLNKFEYFLKCDINKYFQSVDHQVLFGQIKRYVKDEKFLYYVKMIIDSYKETREKGVESRESLNFNHQSPIIAKKGMPIGNVISQLFANIYLHDLDFYVEHTLKPFFKKEGRDIFYIRYVDDFIFLAKTKEDLILIRKKVLDFIENRLYLRISDRKFVLNHKNMGIPFLGYVIFPNRLKIRNDTLRRFKRKINNYSIPSLTLNIQS